MLDVVDPEIGEGIDAVARLFNVESAGVEYHRVPQLNLPCHGVIAHPREGCVLRIRRNVEPKPLLFDIQMVKRVMPSEQAPRRKFEPVELSNVNQAAF